jgi:hypothetical protein
LYPAAVKLSKVVGYRGAQVRVHHLPDLLHGVGGLGEGLPGAVEVVERLGPVLLRGEQVVEIEPQLLGQLADLGVVLVDQLAPVLCDLSVAEGAAERPATAAEPGVALVDGRDHARLLEPVGAGQAGKAGAHDGDAGRGDHPDPAHHLGHAGERDARECPGLEKLAPADPVARLLLENGVYRPSGRDRFSGDAEGMDELLE